MSAPLKQRIHARQPTFGSWITIGDPDVAEIMCDAGFEWLVVDLEHSTIGTRQAGDVIRTIDRCCVVPMVRLSENDPTQIKRMMDAGAAGIIVPMVNTPGQASRAVRASKYPPEGDRSFGLARAQGYGFAFDEYLGRINDESILIVQIEHAEAVSGLEAILAVPGVDGLMVGPYDLSGSLGVPGQFEHPDVRAALETVSSTARGLNVATGFHVVQPSAEQVRQRLEQGFTFIAVGLDTMFLGSKAREVLADLPTFSAFGRAE